MYIIQKYFITSHSYKKLLKDFWRYPDRLIAIKAGLAMIFVSLPLIILEKPFLGVTLALGVLAGALSETNDHPKGRLKFLPLTILSFFISSLAVSLLQPFPLILGTGFVASTIVFILLGGIGERYRTITFGAILVGIYAMLGASMSPAWYWQPILLPGGALIYGLLSLALLYYRPWRLLEEQLAKGFQALAAYLEEKARLFPSEKSQQAEIRNHLALLNINVVNALEKIKEVLNNYSYELDNQYLLSPYLRRFILLQELHERATSSHERYELLALKLSNREVLEGIGEMIRQLSYATKQVADNILTEAVYRHPLVLDWIIMAIESKLNIMTKEDPQSLQLLYHNLNHSHLSLKNLDDPDNDDFLPKISKDQRSFRERLCSQLNWEHPRVHYAIRLSLCFFIGYILVQSLQMEKGQWIMLTSLFVSQITYIETRSRLWQRIMGTVTGVIFGVLLLYLLPNAVGRTLLMYLSAIAFFYYLRSNYSLAVVFITIFVLCAFNIISSRGFEIMIPRLIGTFIGAGLAFIAIRLLWPDWQYHRLPHLISSALLKNLTYFKAILQEYDEKRDEDDYDYRVARRQAHLADNELAMSWQSMRMEPKSKRKMIQFAFNFSYLNHSLLSYISALGSHRDSNSIKFDQVKDITQQIEKALTAIGEFLQNQDSIMIKNDLVPLLLLLRKKISISTNQIEKQQLRILFNITDICIKITKELKEYSTIK